MFLCVREFVKWFLKYAVHNQLLDIKLIFNVRIIGNNNKKSSKIHKNFTLCYHHYKCFCVCSVSSVKGWFVLHFSYLSYRFPHHKVVCFLFVCYSFSLFSLLKFLSPLQLSLSQLVVLMFAFRSNVFVAAVVVKYICLFI